MHRFETYRRTERISYPSFTCHFSFQSITGINLHSRLGGEDLHLTPACWIIHPAAGLVSSPSYSIPKYDHIRLPPSIGMIRIYTFSDSMRHTKIKGSTGHRKIFSCNTFLIIVWSKTICVYPKLLVLHAFRKISRNIKKRMMGKIKHRGCIRSCLVCQIQRIIILTKTIDQRHFQVSGETIFSIRRKIRQTDLCVSACSTFHILSAKRDSLHVIYARTSHC